MKPGRLGGAAVRQESIGIAGVWGSTEKWPGETQAGAMGRDVALLITGKCRGRAAAGWKGRLGVEKGVREHKTTIPSGQGLGER